MGGKWWIYNKVVSGLLFNNELNRSKSMIYDY